MFLVELVRFKRVITKNYLRLFLALGLIFPLESLAIDLKEYPLLTPLRLELTREYCKQHYGLDNYNLVNPKMIVIHFTGTDSLEGSLGTFKPETIATSRVYVKKFGKVNVGVHFLISKAGEIYSLLPENIIGRHTIGFNHLSLGWNWYRAPPKASPKNSL